MEKGLEVNEDGAPASVLITYNFMNGGVVSSLFEEKCRVY